MINQFETDLTRIEELLSLEKIHKVSQLLSDRHPSDVAYLVNHTSAAYQHMLLPLLRGFAELDEVVYRLDEDVIVELMGLLQADEVGRLFSQLDSDNAVKILGCLPDELVEWVMLQIPKAESDELDLQLQYDEDRAGRIMSTGYFSIHEDATVHEAFSSLRQSVEAELIYNIYVIDDRRHLVGVFSLRELLLQPNHLKVHEFMNEQVVSVRHKDDQEAVAKVVERLGISAVPVVNDHLQLVGIVTMDDVIGIIRSETTEDIMKLAGTTDGEYSLPSPMRNFMRRMPWLMVSFFGGMLTIQTNLYFAGKVPHIELLAFVTIIAGMGGNIASQSSTIVVRGLATGRIMISELWTVLVRETLTGTLLGVFFGGLVGLAASYEFQHLALIGVSVAVGMVFSMVIAAFVGTLMPMVFERLKIDPAVATGPFVSTTIDNLGLLGFFGSTLLILSFVE